MYIADLMMELECLKIRVAKPSLLVKVHYPWYHNLSLESCVGLNQVVGVTSIACGMIAVGSCNGSVSTTILQTLMEKTETELKDTYSRFLSLGLGLVFLGICHIGHKSISFILYIQIMGIIFLL